MDRQNIKNPEVELAWHTNRGNSESRRCRFVIHGTQVYVIRSALGSKV